MAYKIIRPRHGIRSLWNQYKSRIYKQGEMLVESPESGVGSGAVNVKFGDGASTYEKLPYAIEAPISQCIEGSTKPMTSGAGFEMQKKIQDQINGLDFKEYEEIEQTAERHVYKIGNTKHAIGTMVVSGKGDYFQLFTLEQLKTMLKEDSIDQTRLSIAVNNGDAGAASAHFYQAEFWGSYKAYFVYYYPSITGSIRANYKIEYKLKPNSK